YHKSPGYRRSKYRLRRYGAGDLVHLERKTRRGDRVRKCREAAALADLLHLLQSEADLWFPGEVERLGLGPAGLGGYPRNAFLGMAGGPVRLTIDRDIVGLPADGWSLPESIDGTELLPGRAILELKFRAALPGLFREALGLLRAQPSGASKYGRCVAS